VKSKREKVGGALLVLSAAAILGIFGVIFVFLPGERALSSQNVPVSFDLAGGGRLTYPGGISVGAAFLPPRVFLGSGTGCNISVERKPLSSDGGGEIFESFSRMYSAKVESEEGALLESRFSTSAAFINGRETNNTIVFCDGAAFVLRASRACPGPLELACSGA
jgi:hypothetical protein